MLSSLIFLVVLSVSIFIFYKNIMKIYRNINLGKHGLVFSNSKKRWKNVLFIAFGQSKMFKKPIVAILHLVVYLGFIIINIEVIEIIIDGIFGTHRVLSFIGPIYNILIASFEILALLVLIACIVFLIRRNVIKIKRFFSSEMKGWPTLDANLILIFEIFLMSAFLVMNAADLVLQEKYEYYPKAGLFPVSYWITFFINDLSIEVLIFIERFCWWFHIVGILIFLNYLVISKHLHILLGFPNTYFGNLNPNGQFNNMDSVTNEVKMMLDPNADPFSQSNSSVAPSRFGAKDATDLTWLQLLNSYSCTECGRCTSECPANVTGKKLSPRKIMMDVRDRIEEIGDGIDKNGKDFDDGMTMRPLIRITILITSI